MNRHTFSVTLSGALAALTHQICTAVTCKQGYVYFNVTGVAVASAGCYKAFGDMKTWHESKSICEDSSYTGFNGALAAARSQEEQDFLLRLVGELHGGWGKTFWMSGNSLGPSSSGGQWTWGSPYFLDVRFRDTNWEQGMIVNTLPRGGVGSDSYFPNMAIVNGFRAAYAWKISNTSARHSYVCRKEACEDGYDVLDGLCQHNAYSIRSEEESQNTDAGWIVGVVVIGIILSLILLLVGMWKFQNDKFNHLILRLKYVWKLLTMPTNNGVNTRNRRPMTERPRIVHNY